MTCCASGVGTDAYGNFQYATLELIPIMLALTGLFYCMYLQEISANKYKCIVLYYYTMY